MRPFLTFLTLLLSLSLGMIAPAHAGEADDLRATGQVGERPDGLMGLVSSSAPASIRQRMEAVNQARLQLYRQRAAEAGQSLQTYQAIAGQKIIQGSVGPGEYFMDASGQWVRK